jgi:hypothetical protein
MKKTLKIFYIIFGALLIAIIVLSALAKFKEKEIADIALQKISKSIKAPIKISNISLSLLRRFPLATIEFENIWLGSPNALSLSDSLISGNETLAKIEKIYVSVKSIPLFKGELEIMKVEIKGVDFNYIVNVHGTSNFNFLVDTAQSSPADTSSTNLNIELKELSLRDVHCNYIDSSNFISAQLFIPLAEVNGGIHKDYIHGTAEGLIKLASCNYKTSTLHFMREAEIYFNVGYSRDSVDVKKLILTTEGALLNFAGIIVLKDTIETHMNIEGTKIDIGKLIKYIPEKTLDNIGLTKASGILNLKASIQGFISDSILPEVKMDFKMDNGTIHKVGYPDLKNISFDGSFTNGKMKSNKTTDVDLKNFHIETEMSKVNMSFSLKNLDRIQYRLNSYIEADLSEFNDYIPDTIISDMKGQIKVKFDTKGILPDSIKNDFIDYLLETSMADITFNNLFIAVDSTLSLDSLSGHLAYELNHITARDFRANVPIYKIHINNTSFDAELTGKPSRLASFGIELKSYQVRTDSCAVYGSAKIQNLNAPEYYITSNIRLNLSELNAFLPDTLVSNLSGEITAQIASGGRLNLDSIPSQMSDLIFKNSSFRFNFDKVSVDMPDNLLSVKEFSGRLSMKPDTIQINNARGIYSGVDFSIDSTKIVNLYNSVIKNQVSQLYVEGRFSLGDLDYRMFAPFINENTDTAITSIENKDASSATKDAGSNITNYTFLIKGKLKIRSFAYRKALVENISGLFNLSDSLYLVDQFKFNGFGGRHSTSVRYSIKENERTLWVKNRVEEMDVNQLLKDFDNFKDYYEPAITYKNISGILSANVDGQVLFIGDSLILNKLYVRSDIKLEKGGIYNYQPMQDMAQYLPGIDNLDKLEFKTIKSNVFVFQDAIYVPTTLVVSNKLDATALGMKSFGEDYSYHFMVFLSDILTGKSKKISKKQDEIGDEITETGRKGISVKSYSINGKSRNGLDNEKDRKEMERRVKTSEVLLNLRFHPNMVNYNTRVN